VTEEDYIRTQREENAAGALKEDYDTILRKRVRFFGPFVRQGESVLDIGCRDGVSLREMTKENREILGIEIVPEFAEKASSYGEVICADFQKHDFDRKFDWIFCSHTLEHMPGSGEAFDKMASLATRGIFLVLPLEYEEEFKKNASHFIYYPRMEGWIAYLKRETLSSNI
jgi:2-polyprenyl-3-methyl-5-hydroxy-6-metoxy-1,4-benzoquinol methylase